MTLTLALAKVRSATRAIGAAVRHGATPAFAGVDMIPPAVMAAPVRAAITGVQSMAPPTGGRGRASTLAGAKQPIAAGVAISGDEVVAVGVPGTAFGGGSDRAVGLPEQPSFGVRGPTAKQQQTQ